jgi:hypothetical protein
MYDVIRLFFIFSGCLFLGCNNLQPNENSSIQLKFLDEFVLPNDLYLDATLVGGLSGIDFHNSQYYMVCDDSKNPRFYKANISISNYKFDTIQLNTVVTLAKSNAFLDLESIVVDSVSNEILLVSEGKINKGMDPSFFSVNELGEFKTDYKIPQYFRATGKYRPRDNGVFEGLSKDFNNDGYWIATELPLKTDGPKPKFTETTSPVRFTFFNKEGETTKQFAYLLDRVGKRPLGDFSVNGVTDLLAYAPNKLLIIERSYSSGYKNQGNVIKLYSVNHSNAVNTINIKRLTKVNYYPVKKDLIFDFATVQEQLTNKSIDNIEGMCFGPILPNGNKSIILISDNNFNMDNNQINQFILMEVLD